MHCRKPIFIVGVGRSGSTIFHRVFCEHPQVAWLSSRLCNKYPTRPSLNNKLMNVIDYPLIADFIKNRFPPGEAYIFWDNYYRGFSTPCRDLVDSDVTLKVKKRFQKALTQILTPKRNRALIKITGWNRMGYLSKIFNDAKFIHMKRDPRGVINSMVNVDFWRGWRGPANWRWGELNQRQREEWEKFDKCFLALAGIELQIIHDAFTKAKNKIDKNKLMEIHYEKLCDNPFSIFREVVTFCELDWPSSFERAINKFQFRNTNFKWREELTDEQQRIVEYFVAPIEKG